MKTIKIAAMAAGVLLLAGCGNKAAQNATDTGAPKAEEKSTLSETISSIRDAMSSGKAMQCTYVVKDEKGGEINSAMYVDGKKYAGTTTVAGNVQHIVFDGEVTYFWSEGQKQGMKMTKACSEELAANVPKGQTDNTPAPAPAADTEKTFDNATDVKCAPNNKADFSVPTDVTFADQCEMLKNMRSSIPSGVNVPNMPAGVPTNLPAGVTPPQL